MRQFTDLDGDTRLRIIGDFEARAWATGDWHYSGPYLAINVPNHHGSTWAGLALMDSVAASHDLVRDDDGYFFPLVSDRVPSHMEHDGPAYCGLGRRGYRLVVSYRPRA